MIGTKISHYTILERIGEGGMGEVYRAFDPRLDRTIALKVLHPSAVADETKLQRFMQEARTASALNHPNILTIHEIGQENNRHFIATEYIEGKTLRKRLRNGPLPVKVVLEIGTQVIKAIGVAHQAGIIHRDIKPENIMIRSDGYVKVLDFGLAKLIESTTMPGVRSRAPIVKTENDLVVGTVRYMSPEQVQHQPVDHRTDLFSFGAVLYEMLTGQLPFAGQQAIDIAYEIISAEPKPLSELISGTGLEFQLVIERCLAKDPNTRYQDVPSLLKDLRHLHRRIELVAGRTPTDDLPPGLADSARVSQPPSSRPAMVVLYFENLIGNPELNWWRNALMGLFTARLMSNIYLDVVSDQQVRDIIEQLSINSDQEIDKVGAGEIARRAGVESFLIGSFTMLTGGVSISAHLHNVNTGRPIVSVNARRPNLEEIFVLIDEIAGRVERELDVAGIETPDVASLVTGSLVALRAFQTGTEYYQQGELAAAEQYFHQAIAADPRFSLAYYYLSRVERWQDKPESRQHLDAALECAASARDRLRFAIERASQQQDYITQMRMAEEMIVQYPREKLGYIFLAEAYQWRGECERALVIFQQALAFDNRIFFQGAQRSIGINSLFECYLDTGNFGRAEQFIREELAVHSQNWLAHLSLGIIYYYRRAYSEASAAFTQAANLNNSEQAYPQFWQARIHLVTGAFEEAEQQFSQIMEHAIGAERLLYRRELAETMRERGRLRDWFKLMVREPERSSNPERFSNSNNEIEMEASFAPQFWRAYFFEQVGQLDQALNEYELALQRCNSAEQGINGKLTAVWARVHLGRMLSARGEYDRVAELAEQIKIIGGNLPNPRVEQLAFFLWGTNEFYLGNYEQAVQLLERSIWSYYNGFALSVRLLAQCLRQLKEYTRALELLELLQPYGTIRGYSRFCSRTQLDLEIAKTYEAGRQPDRAIEYYQKCLQSWANADADFISRQEADMGLALLTR